MLSLRVSKQLVYFGALLFAVGFGTSAGQTAAQLSTAQDAKIQSRIDSFNTLSPEARAKVNEDLQKESNEHYGFTAFKSISDLSAVDIKKLNLEQKKFIDETTMHVVDGNLVPVAVLNQLLKPTGDQIYDDLQALILASMTPEMLAITKKVGRIRYWIRNNQGPDAMQETDANPAGTGFVIAPGMIATACHVLDYFTDPASGAMSSTEWVKIDFGADSQTHQAYLITDILGRGSIEGEDYAILRVNEKSDNGGVPLPDPMTLGVDSNTSFVGVIGYPNLDLAISNCSGGNGCDETSKWFVSFTQKNQGVIKILSPGRKTGNFQPLGFPIFTYDSPTFEGQSGSPVIDLVSKQVIGLHYCCTGYKEDENEPTCARLKPLSLGIKAANEALAIKDVSIPK